jgi:hypothetical protein
MKVLDLGVRLGARPRSSGMQIKVGWKLTKVHIKYYLVLQILHIKYEN